MVASVNHNNNTHNADEEQPDPATTSLLTGAFPPCTAEECQVLEEEKQASAARQKSRPSCEMTEKCVNACAAYGRVCPCAARIASHAACDAMLDLQKDSKVFPEGQQPDFTYLNAEDLQIGEKLGEGGFSNVNLCIVLKPDHPDYHKELAVKYLKRKAMVDLHHFKHGAADLAVEAYFLQTLSHPNIVQLHGITAGSVETNVATGKECGFFIVVDRLYDTLEHKLEVWRKQEHENPPHVGQRGGGSRSTAYKEHKRGQVAERCQMALSIAKAMQYLHSLGIVFRDLKPDNIGFDKDGVLKLFDFGLAKELKHPHADGRYQLTGHTGSRRYMAPEVALDQPYNQSVDVFSFGILLWELCSAEKPFYGYSSNKHMQLVVLGGERPKMDSSHTQFWPPALQNLMKKCWARDAAQRPSFDQVIAVLETKVLATSSSSSSTSTTSEKPTLNSQGSLGLEEYQPSEELTTAASSSSSSPTRGFGRLFHPHNKRNERSKSGGGPGGGGDFCHVQPAKPQGRARSWGFGARR